MLNVLILILLFSPMAISAEQDDKHLPLNTPPPEWIVSDWLNSEPLTLKELQGQIVLVRWWTGPACPYCINSAAALNEFHDMYKNDGLQVLGFYHHKSRSPFDQNTVREYVKNLNFKFPVAIDHNWKTLNEWWLQDDRRKWTSVSFLLDKEGVVRYIHPGGQYVKGDGVYEKIQQEIEKLLKEK